MADTKPEDMEDEDTSKEAEDESPDPDAVDDEPDKDAEDDGADPDDDDDVAAEDEESDKGLSKAEKAAFAKGRRAERKRIGAILGSPSAEVNPGLAAHLAFKTADSPKKALAALRFGGPGKSASGSLSERMNARGPSRTGRGGEKDVRNADAASAWDGALAKAGKLKGK
ncbi:MAG: hypothetical protein QHC90_25870 [Shinella sp.]|nr:hypothetical protein [Shinella sp.]